MRSRRHEIPSPGSADLRTDETAGCGLTYTNGREGRLHENRKPVILRASDFFSFS